ncbi:threonine/homoserine efflux transporter RhtA [Pseudonocardia sediminis]|uniref:Threonine/homoserine efflux transporter RhtA n=1 Tax=Pseudonocardia sediminis TaxID=1397368 RepID=A0A4Q7UUU2_PSEST|nr:threonine/homoserine efflux transporter RhtA [Pseudonocardia sediminis]
MALAAGVTVTAWASAFVAIRAVGPVFGAGPLALGRLLVGGLALTVAVLPRRAWVRPTRREWLLLAVCGVSWFGVYNVALNAAEAQLDAGTAAMLVNIGPILIALSAGALLGEGFPKPLLLGAGIGFAGAVLIGFSTAGAGSRFDLTGAALCVLAAVTWTIGVLTQKPVLRRLPALQVTQIACVIGAVACLPWAGGLVDALGSAPAPAVAGMVYLGLIPTALAFGTWAYALSRMDAGRLGITTYLVPTLTVLMAWPLLGELPPALALLGGVCALTGVALSRWRSRPATASPAGPDVAHPDPAPQRGRGRTGGGPDVTVPGPHSPERRS